MTADRGHRRPSTPRRHRPRLARSTALAVALALALALAACSDDGDDDATGDTSRGDRTTTAPAGEGGCQPVGDAADAESTMFVTVREWAVEPSADTVSAGTIQLVVENTGTVGHALYVVRAEDSDDLPLDEGRLDVAALGDDLLGTLEAISSGDVCEGTFTFEPGTYQLVGGAAEGTGGEAADRPAEGMVAPLVVE